MPKASLAGRTFDLRILVIKGRARHIVVRTSSALVTNLHLGNRRGDLVQLRVLTGKRRWHAITRTAEQAASLFPNSLYVAVDLMVSPGFRKEVILETNAFGDLLPGIHVDDRDTYESEVMARIESF